LDADREARRERRLFLFESAWVSVHLRPSFISDRVYYENVLALVRGTDEVLIFGAGEAKVELKKRLEREKTCPSISSILPADKMTDTSLLRWSTGVAPLW
jgi:hypothetical protein